MNAKKTYKVAGSEALVQFSPREVQAIYPIHSDACCPLGFSVVLTNGRSYRLHPQYYSEVRGILS